MNRSDYIISAYYCRESYPEAQKDVFPADVRLLETKETDTQCYCFVHDNWLWFVYRGTEPKLRDIWTDIQIKRKVVPFSGMRENTKIRGYTGFLNGYLSVRSKVHDAIKHNLAAQELNGVRHVGHSLGGALAFWSILDCTHYFKGVKHEGCSFGQPKTGNRALARSFNKRVKDFVRIKNHFDIVTLLPFLGMHSRRLIRLRTFRHSIDRYIRGIRRTV